MTSTLQTFTLLLRTLALTIYCLLRIGFLDLEENVSTNPTYNRFVATKNIFWDDTEDIKVEYG